MFHVVIISWVISVCKTSRDVENKCFLIGLTIFLQEVEPQFQQKPKLTFYVLTETETKTIREILAETEIDLSQQVKKLQQ